MCALVKYIHDNLPTSLAVNFLADVGEISPAEARNFCNYYKFNPGAIKHFSFKDLIENEQLWLFGTTEGQQRTQWREQSYPKDIQLDLENYVSILVCGKCKKRKVDYYKMQIRGADEPMTVFAHCLLCDHKWVQ